MARSAIRNGEVSFWMQRDNEHVNYPQFEGTSTYDLVIVGGGLTGLWAAYYAKKLEPSLEIAVLEAEIIGYGASGRNGGWLSALVPGNRKKYATAPGSSTQSCRAFQREMISTVDEVLNVCRQEHIDADQVKGGNLAVATTVAGLNRLKTRRGADLRYGFDEDEVELLDASQISQRVRVAGVHGGLYYPNVARIDPAKLVRQLGRVIRKLGVDVFEGSRVLSIDGEVLLTAAGHINSRYRLICTEGYSGPLVGDRRLIPVNSSMIVTQPLSDTDWSRIGWNGMECLSDAAHTFIYAQRTVDGRIAIGGRGSPYRFASGTGGRGETSASTVTLLHNKLQILFPEAKFVVDHAWSGVLGVTRDWCASINFDRSTGTGSALGYAGHGVTATNLAGRTLADQVLGIDSELTKLPWVGYKTRNWEPEPIRWLGVHAMYRLFGVADSWEESRHSTKTSLIAKLGSRLAGLHE